MKPSLPLLAALCAVSAASAETAPNVALSELGTAVKVAAAMVSFDGGLSTPVSPFSPMLYEPGWTGHGATSVPGEDADGWHRFTMRTANASGAPRIDGRSRFAETGDGAIRAEWTATPSADATLAELFVAGSVPFSRFGGGTALLDGRALEIPVQIGPKAHLFRGAVTNFALLDRDGAERLRVAFDAPTRILLQDGRHWDGTALSLRFFFAEGPVEGGRRYEVRSTVRTPADGPLVLSEGNPVTLEAGPDWIPLEGAVWIEPGSALDFSRVVPHHAPAGQFGCVVAVGGHFEFEGLPGEPQRFYGVNLCGDANTPSTREAADRFAANLARMGYNAVRFHHHERVLLGGAYREGMDDTRPDPAAMERFDALVAACVEHGIYLTTWFTTWRSLGIDRDGCITSTGDYKLLCAFWEPAFTNLCEWSRAFLGHVNPHTGRSLAEEPALCALALVNEGNLGNWNTAPLRDLPGVATAWRHWLAAKRNDGALRANDGAADAANEGGGSAANEGAPVIVAEGGPVIAGAASPVIAAEGRPVIAGEAGPSFDWNSIPDEIPDAVYADDGSTPERRHAAAFAIFLAEREERLASRLRDFLRDELHCKAPVSSLSCWYNPVQYQLVRERCFDYVDDHFYVDHPSFLGESWKLPSRCPNANPILGPGAGSRSCAFRRLLDKPFCITEWNYAGPGRYRGVGGIATGALGALQDWSGLWRFAWSHGKAGVETPEKKTMGYFDVSGDPLSLAAERAALCLFLRRDLEPLAAESPIVLDEAALLDPRNGVFGDLGGEAVLFAVHGLQSVGRRRAVIGVRASGLIVAHGGFGHGHGFVALALHVLHMVFHVAVVADLDHQRQAELVALNLVMIVGGIQLFAADFLCLARIGAYFVIVGFFHVLAIDIVQVIDGVLEFVRRRAAINGHIGHIAGLAYGNAKARALFPRRGFIRGDLGGKILLGAVYVLQVFGLGHHRQAAAQQQRRQHKGNNTLHTYTLLLFNECLYLILYLYYMGSFRMLQWVISAYGNEWALFLIGKASFRG